MTWFVAHEPHTQEMCDGSDHRKSVGIDVGHDHADRMMKVDA